MVGILTEVAVGGGALLGILGVVVGYAGVKRRRRARRVRSTPASDAADLEAGTRRVRGEVVPPEVTVTSPVTESDCVLAAWELRERPDVDRNTWDRAAWGVESTPFYLEDDTGRVLVDAGSHAVGNESSEVFTPEALLADDGVAVEGLVCEFEAFPVELDVGMDERAPGHLEQFLEGVDAASVGSTAPLSEDSERKFSEALLRPGDEVSVLGEARRRDGEVVLAPGEPPLLVSTRPLSEAPDGTGSLWLGIGMFAVGVGLVAAGLSSGIRARVT